MYNARINEVANVILDQGFKRTSQSSLTLALLLSAAYPVCAQDSKVTTPNTTPTAAPTEVPATAKFSEPNLKFSNEVEYLKYL